MNSSFFATRDIAMSTRMEPSARTWCKMCPPFLLPGDRSYLVRPVGSPATGLAGSFAPPRELGTVALLVPVSYPRSKKLATAAAWCALHSLEPVDGQIRDPGMAGVGCGEKGISSALLSRLNQHRTHYSDHGRSQERECQTQPRFCMTSPVKVTAPVGP
jgi:hypothetical protein